MNKKTERIWAIFTFLIIGSIIWLGIFYRFTNDKSGNDVLIGRAILDGLQLLALYVVVVLLVTFAVIVHLLSVLIKQNENNSVIKNNAEK